jgi:hypothetical protein
MARSYNLHIITERSMGGEINLLGSYGLLNNESQLTENGSKLFLYIKKNNIEWKNDPR